MSINEVNKWKFVGGQVCLDFINSVGGRVWEEKDDLLNYKILADKLESFTDLLNWAKNIGILNEVSAKKIDLFTSQNEKTAIRIFQKALMLRESIYRIFFCLSEHINVLQEDIDLLNEECMAAREKQKLIFDSNKFAWDFEPNNAEPESIIWHITLSAAELLTSDKIKRIKQCPGDNCGWLFFDTSKNGTRQWCDMKVCGNLAKVRRFREKNKI